jgi:hypothetical protein
MIIRGILNHESHIGGETEGWVLLLDSDSADGNLLDEIELEAGDNSLSSFLDKHVEIKGEQACRWGVERGDYTVVVVETIREI